ncbi:MAG: hypothetical protein J3R72DRAFT_447099 [Linnemannia gamsii]|nr:MAG: hypothetical protein J3R72DRAFT_447099 [Linnemannia gamsii]
MIIEVALSRISIAAPSHVLLALAVVAHATRTSIRTNFQLLRVTTHLELEIESICIVGSIHVGRLPDTLWLEFLTACRVLGRRLACVGGHADVVLLGICATDLVAETVVSDILGNLAGGFTLVQGMVEQVAVKRECLSASVSLLPTDTRIASTSAALQVRVASARALLLYREIFSKSRTIVDILGVVTALGAVFGGACDSLSSTQTLVKTLGRRHRIVLIDRETDIGLATHLDLDWDVSLALVNSLGLEMAGLVKLIGAESKVFVKVATA